LIANMVEFAIERARQLDPLSVIIAADNAVILYCSRQYDRAIEKFSAAREMEPGFPRAEMIIAPYAEKGMFAEALAESRSGTVKNGFAYVMGMGGLHQW
jgi:hypothetical protein